MAKTQPENVIRGSQNMVPVRPGKSILFGDGKPPRQFPFIIGGPGSHFVHSQSRGLLLLVCCPQGTMVVLHLKGLLEDS